MARPATAPNKGKAALKLRDKHTPLSVHRELVFLARPATAPAFSPSFCRQAFFGLEGVLDYEELDWPPLRIFVMCSLVGQSTIVINDVSPLSTIGELKAIVYERLLLTPHHALQLSSWGRMLEDRWTLLHARLPNDARLQLHLLSARPDPFRGLKRVRIASTCLRTRQLPVEERMTVGSLKARLADALRFGEQSWHTSDV